MASALGTGILGLLAGLGQGMAQERERKRSEDLAERERKQTLTEKEQERQDRLYFEGQRVGAEQNRLEEERRSNKAREESEKRRVEIEGQRALDQSTMDDIMLQVTGRFQKYENDMDMLRLENQVLKNMKLLGDETDPTKTPGYAAQKFISEGTLKLISDPSLLRQPDLLADSIKRLRTEAYTTYGTTGNPAEDQILLESLKNLAGGTEDTSKGGNMPTTGQPNPFMRYLTGAGKTLGGLGSLYTEELFKGTAEKSLKESARRNYRKSKTPRTER